MFATIVTLAIVRGQMTANTQKADRAVVATLDRLVEQASTISFAELADGTFSRPSSEGCDDPSTSCPTLFKRSLEVTWAVSSGGEADDSDETIDWVELRAETVWAGTTFTSIKKVTAPTPNWRKDWGVLRVSLEGSDYVGDIYLVDATTGKPAAGAAQVINGAAWLSAPLESCGTSTNGCVLALGPFGALSAEGVGLDAVSAMTELQLRQNEVTETSVLLRTSSEVSLSLLASNGSGETIANPHVGSVCIWARFHDGLATRTVPFCNDTQSDQIVIDTYRPDTSRAWLRLAVPSQVPVKLYIDDPEGGCGLPTGTFRWDGNSWVSGGTCTAWTWGSPSTLTSTDPDGTSEEFEGSVIDVRQTPTRYDITWTTAGGLPAAGGAAFQAMWANPRDADLISSGSCSPSAPHCKSGALVAPVLTSPRTSGFRVPSVSVTPGGATTFTLSANDYDWEAANGQTVITAGTLPTGTIVRLDEVLVDGQMTIVETALTSGDVIVADSGPIVSAQLRYYAPSGTTQRRATFVLANGSGTRTVSVVLAPELAPHSLRAEPSRLSQGTQGSIKVLVIGTNGAPLSGVVVTPANLPSGITASPSTTGADGWASVPVSVTNTPAGQVTFQLQTSGGDGNVRLTISPRAGDITLSSQLADPVIFDQGTTTQIQFTVSDRAGQPRTGTAVAVWATRPGGSRTTDVYATSRGCETDNVGSCTVSVAATNRAPSGAYVLNVSVEGISEQLNLQVEPKPYRATAQQLTLPQGTSADMAVTIVDGAGAVVAGVAVTATSSTSGLTFSNGTTNANGQVNLSVSVASTTAFGVHPVQLSGGGATGSATIRVSQTVSRLSVTEVVVSQGETTKAEVVAFDSNNQPVPGAVLSAVSADGIVVRATPTDRYGRSIVDVRIPYNVTPTRYLVALSTAGQIVEFLPVRVLRGIGSITVDGTIDADATSVLRLRLLDLSGSAIPSRNVVITPQNNALRVSSNGGTAAPSVSLTSNGNGIVELQVTASTGVRRGATAFRVTSNATSFLVYVQVEGS